MAKTKAIAAPAAEVPTFTYTVSVRKSKSVNYYADIEVTTVSDTVALAIADQQLTYESELIDWSEGEPEPDDADRVYLVSVSRDAE